MTSTILTSIAILVLAAFVGFQVISKVPNTLHTPLMSGTNAIHGIVLLGGLVDRRCLSLDGLLCPRVHDLPVARDAGAGDDLVVEVEVQRAVLADQQFQQRGHVARVQ